MPTTAQAELTHALAELRHAAEALKSFDSGAADRLEAAIALHGAALKAAELAQETAAQRDRILGVCEAAMAAIARSRQYPAQMTARADVLDRAATLGKAIRVLQGLRDKAAGR